MADHQCFIFVVVVVDVELFHALSFLRIHLYAEFEIQSEQVSGESCMNCIPFKSLSMDGNGIDSLESDR